MGRRHKRKKPRFCVDGSSCANFKLLALLWFNHCFPKSWIKTATHTRISNVGDFLKREMGSIPGHYSTEVGGVGVKVGIRQKRH